jgi:mannose-6-phosphate isomerase-like protein (cupin superfamily)
MELAEDPVFKIRSSFRREGESLIVDTWIDPGGGVTPHVHPAMEERFETIEGTAQFLSGRKWVTAPAGEGVLVPPGTRHSFRNRTDEVAHIRCRATPPMTLQEFLIEAAALSRAGKLNKLGLPTSFAALKDVAALAERHRPMVVMSSPPGFVQKLLLPPLARRAEG